MDANLVGLVAETVGGIVISSSVSAVITTVVKKTIDIDGLDSKTKLSIIIGTVAISTVVGAAVSNEVIKTAKETIATFQSVGQSIKEQMKYNQKVSAS